MASWMERGGSQTVPGRESKEGEEGFHSRRTELLSGQHASCELELSPSLYLTLLQHTKMRNKLCIRAANYHVTYRGIR